MCILRNVANYAALLTIFIDFVHVLIVTIGTQVDANVFVKFVSALLVHCFLQVKTAVYMLTSHAGGLRPRWIMPFVRAVLCAAINTIK